MTKAKLSREMASLVREALLGAGWTRERVDELLASGALDPPEMQAKLDDDLMEAFRIAVSSVLGEADPDDEG